MTISPNRSTSQTTQSPKPKIRASTVAPLVDLIDRQDASLHEVAPGQWEWTGSVTTLAAAVGVSRQTMSARLKRFRIAGVTAGLTFDERACRELVVGVPVLPRAESAASRFVAALGDDIATKVTSDGVQFIDSGGQQVAVRELARRAGVSPGTAHHHIKALAAYHTPEPQQTPAADPIPTAGTDVDQVAVAGHEAIDRLSRLVEVTADDGDLVVALNALTAVADAMLRKTLSRAQSLRENFSANVSRGLITSSEMNDNESLISSTTAQKTRDNFSRGVDNVGDEPTHQHTGSGQPSSTREEVLCAIEPMVERVGPPNYDAIVPVLQSWSTTHLTTAVALVLEDFEANNLDNPWGVLYTSAKEGRSRHFPASTDCVTRTISAKSSEPRPAARRPEVALFERTEDDQPPSAAERRRVLEQIRRHNRRDDGPLTGGRTP